MSKECLLVTSNLFDADCITTNLVQYVQNAYFKVKQFILAIPILEKSIKRIIQIETVHFEQLQMYSKMCVSYRITTNLEATVQNSYFKVKQCIFAITILEISVENEF